jgi:aconitate hydratase
MVTAAKQNQAKHNGTKATYITSPPLVLAYALTGNVMTDLEHDPLGNSDITIQDLWPQREEIERIEDELIIRNMLQQLDDKIQVNCRIHIQQRHRPFFHLQKGNSQWDALPIPPAGCYPKYPWAEYSTQVTRPPFFDGIVTPFIYALRKRTNYCCHLFIDVGILFTNYHWH